MIKSYKEALAAAEQYGDLELIPEEFKTAELCAAALKGATAWVRLREGTETYDVATVDHAIDFRCRKVFEDLISRRNLMHWDPMDIENFLLTPGKLVSKCITCTLPELPEALTALLVPEQFKNIEKLIVCGYGCEILLEDWEKVMNNITVSVPDGAEIFHGLISGERADKDRVTVHLIAICSGDHAFKPQL